MATNSSNPSPFMFTMSIPTRSNTSIPLHFTRTFSHDGFIILFIYFEVNWHYTQTYSLDFVHNTENVLILIQKNSLYLPIYSNSSLSFHNPPVLFTTPRSFHNTPNFWNPKYKPSSLTPGQTQSAVSFNA